MKVKNRGNGTIVEATKNDKDGVITYTVEGKELSKEDMSKNYIAVKEKVEPKQPEGVEVISGETDMGGDIGALALALSKAQSEFKSIGKNTEGHGYNFSDFQSVIEGSSPILSKNELSITQLLVTKQVGNTLLSGVKTILIHSSGGYVSGETYVSTERTKMNTLVQIFGVNTSYQKRYGWLSICGLSTTERDTDGRDD